MARKEKTVEGPAFPKQGTRKSKACKKSGNRTDLSRIAKTSCVACGKTSHLDRDHIRSKGSGGTDDEGNIQILCRTHHIERHRIGLSAFTEKYPSVTKGLLLKGWYFCAIRKKWSRDND